MDRAVKLDPDAKGAQRLDASSLEPGLWRVRVSWTSEKQNYYLEQKVVVGSKQS
jgi:nitrogen fixation protein FixH